MIRKILSLFALSIALCFSALAVDTGAVTDGNQTWAGLKVFLDNTPVATTAVGNITLNKNSGSVQFIDPGGSARNVTLPPIADSLGRRILIVNKADAAESITVKNVAATTIGTIAQNEAGVFYCSDTAWYGFTFTSAGAGFLTADGLTTGGTSQTQTFTNGVTLDTIIGATATGMTVTAKVGATNTIGNAITVKAGAGGATNATGGAAIFGGGAGAGTGSGGAATLSGGVASGGATGNGGAASVTGGASTATNGTGGAIAITAGLGTGSGSGGAVAELCGAAGATGAGGAYTATAGRGGSTSGAAGTVIITAGAGGASATVNGGVAHLIGGASGAGATGNGGVAKILAGAAVSTDGTGGAAQVTGGAGAGTGSGGAVVLTPGAAGGGGSSTVGNVSVVGPFSSTVGTVQVIANGNTITLPTTGFNKLITSSAGSVTGIILTVGRFDGEMLTLIKTDAGSATFATSGTSHVADGASAVLATLTRMTLVWDAGSSLWYHGN